MGLEDEDGGFLSTFLVVVLGAYIRTWVSEYDVNEGDRRRTMS